MNEAKRRRLRAYPAETSVVCLVGDRSEVINLAAGLAGCAIEKSSLYYADGFCLGIKVKTRQIPHLLPQICEYSDTVCIGKSYPELFSEHGKTLIKSEALKILSSHRADRRGHVL